MTKITHTCECACGLVQLRCTAEPIRTSICHCFECQKRTGSVFGVQARFHKDQVILDGDTTSYTRIADSGKSSALRILPGMRYNNALTAFRRPRLRGDPNGIV